MDRNRRKRSEKDRKRKETDRNGEKQTETERYRQNQTGGMGDWKKTFKREKIPACLMIRLWEVW